MSKTSHRNRNRRRSKTKDDDQLQQQQKNTSTHQYGINKSHPIPKKIEKTTKQKIGMVVGYAKIILSITLLCFLILTTTRTTKETRLNKTKENVKYNNNNISTPKPLSTLDDDDDAKITRFLSWITSHGGYISPSVTVKTFPSFGGGRGLLALSSINHLDTLYSLPTSLILTASKIAARHSHHFPPNDDDDKNKITFMEYFHKKTRGAFLPSTMKDQDAILALELMRQCYLGDDGDMKPYMDVFPPDEVNRLDSWTPWEREMVQDDALKSYGDESSKRIEWSWREGGVEFIARRMAGVDDEDNDGRYDESCLTLPSFRRFLSLVSSRAMVLDGVKYLTPLADMANYAPRDDGRLKGMGGDYFKLYHEMGRRRVMVGDGSEGEEMMMITVRADRDVEAGKQIFEDYGDTDNTLFLEAHGFVPDENPWHCAIVEFNHLSSSSLGEDKFTILERLGLAQIQKTPTTNGGGTILSIARHPDVCVKRDGTLIDDASNNAGDFLAVLGMDGDALDACRAILDAERYPKVPSEWVTKKCLSHDGRERGEMMALRDAALSTQRRYETSLEDDLELLERAEGDGDDTTTGGALLALKFRISEKREMSYAIASLEERIDDDGDDGKVDVETMTIGGKQTCLNDDDVCSSNDGNIDEQKDFNIEEYESFLDGLGISVRNIKPAYVGDGMRLGAVATKDMSIEDIYFSIPPNSTMSIDTALSNDVLSELIQSNVFDTIEGTTNDDFFPLLAYLLHERFHKAEKSQWWPYLALLPSHGEMQDLPITLSDRDINTLLVGSDIRTDVLSYKRKVERRYHALRANYHVRIALTDDVLTMENVLWAHVTLDTRSIWWSGRRHLVPMLDLVNAAATLTRDDGPSFVPRVHRTDVEVAAANGKEEAATRISHAAMAGEQVFENYGQPNYILFLYHGFILEENSDDCVLVNNLSFDPRIRWGRRHPTLCIRDDSRSLHQLARVLRDEKTNGNGRGDDDDDDVDLSDDVKDDVRAFLEGRLKMHDDLEEMERNGRRRVVVADGVEKIARQIKRNEREILKRMLERFLKEWYPEESPV